MKTIVICSGGLDSVSLAHKVAADHALLGLLSFDYGQRHRKEVTFAAACAERLQVPHQTIDIRDIGRSLSGSALTDDLAVPDGHYAEETMRITVVPNRNAIMLAIAFGVAAARGADASPPPCMAAIISSIPIAVPALSTPSRPCSAMPLRGMPTSRFTPPT